MIKDIAYLALGPLAIGIVVLGVVLFATYTIDIEDPQS